MIEKEGVLHGQCILNTRPAHQQGGLKALLEAQGAAVIAFPVIEIVDCEVRPIHLGLAQQIEHYDIALFVSRNAVDGAFRFLQAEKLPTDLQLGVIGEATRQALNERVRDLDRRLIRSHPYDSEGLLNASALQQVQGKNILVFRGQQGRNLLGDELSARGATVSFCEVYHRMIPDYEASYFDRLSAQRFPTLGVFTSIEGMYNALSLITGKSRDKLLEIPWLLISERMRESAVELGHNASIIIAKNASDEGIQQAISEWAGEQAD
jgi:uroporphyrinogen-III synthase